MTTTAEDVVPAIKQNIKCDNLGEKRYSLEFDLGSGLREEYKWYPPQRDVDSSPVLELRRIEERVDGEEAMAKILRRNWTGFDQNELIAIVRVTEDLLKEREKRMKGVVDQIMVTAVALIERIRRGHRYINRNPIL